MRLTLRTAVASVLAAIFALLAPVTVAQETQTYVPPSIEEFALRPVMSNVSVSPDGTKLVLMKIEAADGNPVVEIYKVENLTEPMRRLDADPMEFTSVSWVSNDFLILDARQKIRERIEGYNNGVWAGRVLGYNVEEDEFIAFGGRAVDFLESFNIQFENALSADPDKILISEGRPVGPDDPFAAFRPRSYYTLDLSTGRTSLVIKGSDKYGGIDFDAEGNPRFTAGFDDPNNEVVFYYRDPEERSWSESFRIPEEKFFTDALSLIGYDSDRQDVGYVIAQNGENFASLWAMNLRTGEFLEKIAGRPDVDVLAVLDEPGPRSLPHKLGAIIYPGLKYEREYIDPVAEAFYATLEATIPNAYQINVTSMSEDENTYVVANTGPLDPGSFWLVRNGQILKLGSTNPYLEPEELNRVEHFMYQARDGRMIPGHITVPTGAEPPYPLVVMPHGGPYVNQIPEYDPWGQVLASRGFLVFEPNYRGSTGYGNAHFEAAIDEHGGAMQDDKDDGALYLVEQGLADPDRMAMFGWSYGGYAALVAASRDPNLYQCVVAGASVSDPWMQYNYRRGEPGSYEDAFSRQRATGVRPIEEIENVNVPILMIHGDVDQRVPYEHFRKYVPRAERAGVDIQTLTLEGADHFANTLFFHHYVEFYTKLTDYLMNDCGLGGRS